MPPATPTHSMRAVALAFRQRPRTWVLTTQSRRPSFSSSSTAWPVGLGGRGRRAARVASGGRGGLAGGRRTQPETPTADHYHLSPPVPYGLQSILPVVICTLIAFIVLWIEPDKV